MTTARNEGDLIRRIERQFPPTTCKLAIGLGDDAALWRPRVGYEVVLTCDWFLEGSHFLRHQHPADAVGWKCLARAVSDVAAMGGVPRCFLLSIALPAELTASWFDEFLLGLRRASRALRCQLAGGDTARHKKVFINIAVMGEVRPSHALLRSGARPGDSIFVSGTLGEADAGWRELRARRSLGATPDARVKKHLHPEPRLALGQWLASRRLATAAMDLSDGLSSDLPRLCCESGVGARIDLASLPVSKDLPILDARQFALHGGEDYELLFTVAKKNAGRVPKRLSKLKLTRIGEITQSKQVVLNDSGKTRSLEAGGWDPFRK